MNIKIFSELQKIIRECPHSMWDIENIQALILSTFDVSVEVKSRSIVELTYAIDREVMEKYFTKIWQPKTKKYKYSGLSIIDEINALKPLSVVDLGCGYNEFKGKINNLTGIDPYNQKADLQLSVLEYTPKQKHDIAIALGSVNFGSVDSILEELHHIVNNVVTPGGLIFFRGNPGQMHDAPEARWIDFFKWTPSFILNSASALNCEVVTVRQDTDRLYFVWKTGDK